MIGKTMQKHICVQHMYVRFISTLLTLRFECIKYFVDELMGYNMRFIATDQSQTDSHSRQSSKELCLIGWRLIGV